MATVDVMRLPSAERHEPAHRFDYKGQHRYIVTLPTHKGKTLFTDGDRVFGILGILRQQAAAHRFDVYAYCFLPDRLLLIIRGREETSDMKEFLAGFRGGSNDIVTRLDQHPAWSRKYIERVLRKGEESRDIARQLLLAPVKEGLAKSPSEYPYLGSFVVPVEKLLATKPPVRPPARDKRKPFPPGRTRQSKSAPFRQRDRFRRNH
ncbi:MAG TPA: hypothetical protein VMG09_15305 [Bacteroidota bacterium]|nr:hypothetical protein [Bacteroidota bacterium]